MKTPIPILIERGKITFVIYPEKVIVGVGMNQWVSYNFYNNWNRQGISMFRNKILRSGEDEYNNVIDVMNLARECDINGMSTVKPREIKL